MVLCIVENLPFLRISLEFCFRQTVDTISPLSRKSGGAMVLNLPSTLAIARNWD